MENENNNYSFTPITEDNSVNEIKDDFFGGSNPEPSASPTNEVPPILEVPEIKEEETSVSTPAPGPIVNDVVESNNNAETTVELAPVTDPEPTVEKVNQEPTEPVTNEEVTVSPKPITEINAVSAEEATSEPVEVKIPEGLDDEPSEVASAEETAADSTPQVETTTAQVTNPEAKAEAPKKGKSIFDFFKKDTPTVASATTEPSIEPPSELDPFNNFVADVPESDPTQTVSVKEQAIENIDPITEVSLSNQEESPVTEEKKEKLGEVSLPSIDEATIPEPVIDPFTKEDNDLPKFNDIEDNYEPIKDSEPIVKEVVIEKEKVVLGKKCPNCGEVTAETFCPNCGFLVE